MKIEDQKLSRSVYDPASQDKECIQRPEGLKIRMKMV